MEGEVERTPTVNHDASEQFQRSTISGETAENLNTSKNVDSSGDLLLDYSQAPKTSQTFVKFWNVKKILKLKVVPPLRREMFSDHVALQKEMQQAYKDVICVFDPIVKPLTTISRQNLKIGE